MIKQIKRELLKAEQNGKKVVTFHYLILSNASKLKNENPKEYCKKLGLYKGYPTEFAKMINLARFMEEVGAKIT